MKNSLEKENFEKKIFGFNNLKKNYFQKIHIEEPNLNFKEIGEKFFEDNSYIIKGEIKIGTTFFDIDSPNLINKTIKADFYIINDLIQKVTIENEKGKIIDIDLESVEDYYLPNIKNNILLILDNNLDLFKITENNLKYSNPNIDGLYHIQDIELDNKPIGVLKTKDCGFVEGYEENYIIPVLDNKENKNIIINNKKINYIISEDKGYIDLNFKNIESLLLYVNKENKIPQKKNEFKINLDFTLLNNESILKTKEKIINDFGIKININNYNHLGTLVGKKEKLVNFLKNYCQFTNIQIKDINQNLIHDKKLKNHNKKLELNI